MRLIHLLEDHYSDYNRLGKRKGHFIEDILHSDFKDYFANSCFYYSSGSDATPIVGCKKFANIFVYCDIQEFSNFSDAIYLLKKKLRDNKSEEILYCTVPAEWFGLNEQSYMGHYGLDTRYYTKDLKAEFSLWKNENRFFVLIYFAFDNNVIWQNTYLKYKLRPKIICNCNYEGGVDFKVAPLSEDMKPYYWVGYGQHVEGFEPIGKLKYFGEYGGEYFELYANMNLKNIEK